MPLTSSQKRHLRGLTHALGPVVAVGYKGATDAVVNELHGALMQHELVKVKVDGADRAARIASIETMRERCNAELVHTVGHVACFYRRNPERPVITLPR